MNNKKYPYIFHGVFCIAFPVVAIGLLALLVTFATNSISAESEAVNPVMIVLSGLSDFALLIEYLACILGVFKGIAGRAQKGGKFCAIASIVSMLVLTAVMSLPAIL